MKKKPAIIVVLFIVLAIVFASCAINSARADDAPTCVTWPNSPAVWCDEPATDYSGYIGLQEEYNQPVTKVRPCKVAHRAHHARHHKHHRCFKK
jgi:hypothetical protein